MVPASRAPSGRGRAPANIKMLLSVQRETGCARHARRHGDMRIWRDWVSTCHLAFQTLARAPTVVYEAGREASNQRGGCHRAPPRAIIDIECPRSHQPGNTYDARALQHC
eukprot:scaffold66462_cov32-Tisochrysis_lutea.AAC.5